MSRLSYLIIPIILLLFTFPANAQLSFNQIGEGNKPYMKLWGDAGYFCNSKISLDTKFLVYFERIDAITSGLRLTIVNPDNQKDFFQLGTINNYNFNKIGRSPKSFEYYNTKLYITTSSIDNLYSYTFNLINSTWDKQVLFSRPDIQKLNLCNNIKIDNSGQAYITFGISGSPGQIWYSKSSATLVSTEEITYKNQLYPNPLTSQLKIDGDFEDLSIFDMNGKLVLKSTQNIIPLTQFKPGLYLASLNYKKLIIK